MQLTEKELSQLLTEFHNLISEIPPTTYHIPSIRIALCFHASKHFSVLEAIPKEELFLSG